MDRTAIASIIIGLGATVAAMVMPQKYPNAPKSVINLSWFGGVSLVVAGTGILLTDLTTGDLAAATAIAARKFLGLIGETLSLPISWVVLAFIAGAAAMRWHPLLWKAASKLKKSGPRVLTWHSPAEISATFWGSDLVAKSQSAQESVVKLKQKVIDIESNTDAATDAKKELEEAEYLAKCRRADVIGALHTCLRVGLFVGRGRPMKMQNGAWVKDEKIIDIPKVFWAFGRDETDIINLETGEAISILGSYQDVTIGRDEDHEMMIRARAKS